jgi:thioesterase domain-containing protein
MSQQLSTQGERANLLGLVDTSPPELIPKTRRISRFAQHLVFVGAGVTRHLRALWQEPTGTRLAYLRDKSRILMEVLTRRDVYRGDRQDLYRDRVARANQRAASRYVPAPGDSEMVLILSGRTRASRGPEPRLRWTTLARGGSTVVHVPGDDSGSLLKAPHVRGLADALRDQLGSA